MAETAFQIQDHHVDMFKSLVQLRAQQLTSKLRDFVMVESATGRAKYFDQIGSTQAQEDNTRYPESPHNEIEHFRRKITPKRIHWGHHIDQFDEAQMFISPQGKYVSAASGAFGRSFDTKIIEAAGGISIAEDPDGNTTQIALPSTQKIDIQVGSTGPSDVNLNEEKIRCAMEILLSNDVDTDDPMNRLYGAITPSALYKGLLSQDKVTSSDFNFQQPLADGGFRVMDWMGIRWVVSNRLPFIGASTTNRNCYVWAKSGIGLGMWSDVSVESAKRADRSFVNYIYMRSFFNTTRIEEEKVVEIAIDESKSALV